MRHFVRGGLAVVMGCLGTACAVQTGEFDEQEVLSAEQSMKNGLVENQKSVVEVWVGDNLCTGTLISQNAIVTAAHCGARNSYGQYIGSYMGNFKVIYQQGIGLGGVWRCLTNQNGSVITGDHATVLSQCPWMAADFHSMFDLDTTHADEYTPAGYAWKAYENDFAVLRVNSASFTWRGTTSADYAYLYPFSAPSTTVKVWGVGYKTPGQDARHGQIDYFKRTRSFTVAFHDTNSIVAPSTNAQICAGDSGGPLGYLSNGRIVIQGVTSRMPQNEGQPSACSIVGGTTYWTKASNRIAYVESALQKTCGTTTDYSGITSVKYCWNERIS